MSKALIGFNGKYIAIIHTLVAYSAFFGALIVGASLHYEKIVKNEYYGYPQEWFPSVSATIGDFYPERSVFQVFIAITSGPRFALIGLWFLLTNRPGKLPKFTAAIGLFRTILCGGWVYVTSTDDHDWHDIFMISYLVATIPWTVGCLLTAPPNPVAMKYRKLAAGLFFGTMVPLIYYFIQHKVHQVAGAYTIYAFFEWSLIIYDVAFDAVAAIDFQTFQLQIVDIRGERVGSNEALQLHEKERYVILEVAKPRRPVVCLKGQLTKFRKVKDRTLIELSNIRPAELVDFLARVYLGFTLWSIWTSLGLLIWYFPLWNMGISGFEVTLLATSAPFLLGIAPLRRLVARIPKVFHALSIMGIAAYKVNSPRDRLLVVTLANIMQTLNWSTIFHSNKDRPAMLQKDALAFCLGLVMSSIAKMSHYANNPIWPIMHAENGGANQLGMLLAIVACLAMRSDSRAEAARTVTAGAARPNWLLSSFGLGGLFFALHSLLSDSSTLVLWVWDGFPIRGPLVVPHGGMTICVMLAGLYTGVAKPALAQSWFAFAVACLGNVLLYNFHGYAGFFGGLLLTFCLLTSAPGLLATASQTSVGRTFGLAFTIYNLLCLMHVWIVAYAFVPGGPLLRERTDLVLLVTMVCIGCGFVNMQARSSSSKDLLRMANKNLQLLKVAIAVLVSATFVITYQRFPTFDYVPYHPEEKLFTAGIWTVHFGLDNDMWASETRMRQIIEELELDVIGLLESDTQRIIMGNRDMTQQVAEEIGMYVDFGPGPNKHTWGAALLSKFPIINSTHHLLPSPVGELAPAIHATLDVYGTYVDVIVSHNGQEEDPEDRRLQSTMLGQIMQDSPRPFVFLGYVVSRPGEYPQRHLTDHSGMNDIEPLDWDRWCEYILFRGLKRVGYARVHRSTITDTEIQTGKFVLQDQEIPASYRRVNEDEVPEGYRYPAQFRGEGTRDHRYNNNHVVQEPWYYD